MESSFKLTASPGKIRSDGVIRSASNNPSPSPYHAGDCASHSVRREGNKQGDGPLTLLHHARCSASCFFPQNQSSIPSHLLPRPSARCRTRRPVRSLAAASAQTILILYAEPRSTVRAACVWNMWASGRPVSNKQRTQRAIEVRWKVVVRSVSTETSRGLAPASLNRWSGRISGSRTLGVGGRRVYEVVG